MHHPNDMQADQPISDPANLLPKQLDCETRALLRLFLNPILESAKDWPDLHQKLDEKGYRASFVQGRMVISNDRDLPVCTGRDLGVPLEAVLARLGAPTR
ncbi:MAG: hypothetical protein N4A61_01585 [Pelagimonas sp.]|jgi:hypothetical protein|nr:hypothetical protein [Pelagimonas sp.]